LHGLFSLIDGLWQLPHSIMIAWRINRDQTGTVAIGLFCIL
jgi:hypothetical protein